MPNRASSSGSHARAQQPGSRVSSFLSLLNEHRVHAGQKKLPETVFHPATVLTVRNYYRIAKEPDQHDRRLLRLF